MRKVLGAIIAVVIAAMAAWFVFTPGRTGRGDVTIATAGPITGQYASFGEQMKRGARWPSHDINAKGGVLGKQARARGRRRRLRSEAGRRRRQRYRGQERRLRGRPFLLRLVDPGLGGLCRGGHPADHAGLDQPEA